MKTLIKNHECVASVLIAILTVFFGQNVAYGLNVADRTPQVRDAIVAAAGVDAPAEVTDAHLSAMTALNLGLSDIVSLKTGDFEGLTSLQALLLNNNQLTALPATLFNGLPSLIVLLLNNNQLTDLPEGVFSDLTALQALHLNNNRLTALPVGVFSGLTALQYVDLENNAVAPMALPVSLERVADGQFKAVTPTGAPFDMLLPIDMTNGSIIGSEAALRIPQGHVESETFRVIRTPGTIPAVTAAIGVLPDLPEAHKGYGLVKSDDLPVVLIRSVGINPLKDRTPQVRDAIVAAAGVNAPAEVTEDHLAAITALSLSFSDITALKAGDFDDLTALQSLYLDNNPLTALPATVFSGLISLQHLDLNHNRLTVLPETVFRGLASLEVLLLNNNALTELPAGVFEGLASLQHLDLFTNRLTSLPAGVFSGLTALQSLSLGNNAVAPMALPVSLERVADGQFKAVTPTGAPFEIRLPFRVTNGRISSGETALTIRQGHLESEVLTVDHTFENLMLVTAAIEALPALPVNHSGYGLVKSSELPLVLLRSDRIHPLSDRTQQVRDAIAAAVGVDAPAEVTEDRLASITALNLGLSDITSLKAGDFDGLTALEVLLLNNNQLTDLPETLFNGLAALQQLDLSANALTFLPAGVFNGLTALQALNLSNNAMDPVALPVLLERVADGQFEAVAPTGAPFDMVLPFRVTNGSTISGATAITIRQGQQESETFRVLRTPGTIAPVTVAIETLPDVPVNHSGYALVASGDLPLVLIGSEGIHPLSARTPQVQDAIITAAGVETPAEVTEALMSAITALDLADRNIVSLNARDFEGLTGLQVLFLNNNPLTALPESVFNRLTSLQYLYLDNNLLTFLPVDVFRGLTSLIVLRLHNNSLTDLPVGVFEGLASLQHLDLSINRLTSLPDGIFSGLASLQALNLNNNAVVPVALPVSLEKVGEGQFKAVAPTGAPFDIVLPIDMTNGSIVGGATGLMIPQGHLESETFSVTRTPGTFAAVTVAIGTLPGLPAGHSGYGLVKSSELPVVLIGSAGINPLSDRTPQVRDAIVGAAGVTSPAEVTADLMSAITLLDLSDSNIVSLKVSDFDGLTALQQLYLDGNRLTFLPVGVFSGLTALQRLDLNNNALIFLPMGIFGGLTSLQSLNLNNNPLTALPAGVFNGLASLQQIGLDGNRLAFLPVGVFSGLTALRQLNLNNNAVTPIGLMVSLERVAEGQFKAVASTGAPFEIRLPIRIANGRTLGGATVLTIPQGHVESETLTVTQTFEVLTTVTAAIETLPDLPAGHSGYALVKSDALPLVLIRSDRIHPIRDRTPQVRDAIVAAAGVTAAAEVTEDHLAAITALHLGLSDITVLNDRDFEGLASLIVLFLNNNHLTDLPGTVFSGLTSLQSLNLESNRLSFLPDGIFSGLRSLESLSLGNNAVAPIPLPVSLERVGEGQLKAVAPTGAPFDVVLPIRVTNGSIVAGATALTIPKGSLESETFIVTRTPGTIPPVTAAIETLPELPVDHSGYALLQSNELPIVLIGALVNAAPVFIEGDSTTRTVAENTAAGTAIGDPVAATDTDTEDTLTYSLGGPDADAFRIVATSGQLQTRVALDYETKASYAVTVSASDGNSGSDRIDVSISVTNVNDVPVFSEGSSTTRAIAENTASGENIGSAVTATDADIGDVLTYSLSGTDASSFRVISTSGQLRTRAALDYETKNAYTVVVSVSDGNGGSDSITVTITVTDVNETPTNNVPVFTEGSRTSRSVAENTASGQNIGAAVAATDADGDTLTYGLGGTDSASFGIVSTSGQLRTRAPLDYETKNTYTVVVSVSDGNGGGDSIAVTINVTDVAENRAPVFTEGSSATRAIAENTPSGRNIGSPVTATDADNDTLTYSLSGVDAAAFGILSTTGQLRTRAALDYETKASYTVSVSVSDGNGGGDSITVTITVTDVNETPVPTNTAPVFTEGSSTTRSVAEGTASGRNIGTPVTATDADGDVLTYSLGGVDAAAFGILSTTGQLRTRAALDYETKSSYAVTVTVSDGNLTDRIAVAITVTDVSENRAPVFTEGSSATRAIAENTPSGRNIGTPIAATDADGDTLTYTLGGVDAAAFGILSTTGQLRTLAALDYETKASYAVTVSVSDGKGGSDAISVTITVRNVAELPSGITPIRQRTRQVQAAIIAAAGVSSPAEVTEAHLAAITLLDLSNKDITALKSGDFDGLTALTTLYLHNNGISDVSPLQHLTSLKTLYLSDNAISDILPLQNLTALIKLPVSDNAISNIPRFEKLTNLTDFYLADNALSDISSLEHLTSLEFLILDNNSIEDLSPLEDLTTLTSLYLDNNAIRDLSPLEGLTNLKNLYLQSNAISDLSPLESLRNLESLNLHANAISDLSPLGKLTNLIELTLSDNAISDVSPLSGLTSLIALGLNGNAIRDLSPFGNLAALIRLNLRSNAISDISVLERLPSLEYLYLSGNPISDYGPLERLKTANPDVFIDIDLSNNPPQFIEGSATTRSVDENTPARQNIGAAVGATDADNDTLIYSLSGPDAAAFRIVRTSGQLRTRAALDYETKPSYTGTVTVYDGNSGGDTIAVTITVADIVGVGPSVETSPVIPENTVLLTNYPNPFNPETWIPYQLAKPADVRLTIYNMRGVVVRQSRLGHQPAGVYQSRKRAIHWDGRNDSGEQVAAGVYFYTLKAGDYTATRKMLICK